MISFIWRWFSDGSGSTPPPEPPATGGGGGGVYGNNPIRRGPAPYQPIISKELAPARRVANDDDEVILIIAAIMERESCTS